MATISNTPRPGYVFDVTDNVWYPIGTGSHNHSEIASTIVDAKGDIIAASAADTPARLAVGNNGETLVADSSTATGLAYREDYAAGKNKIINGDFFFNQRGFTSTTANGTYGFDRFFLDTVDGTCTYSAQTFTAGAAPVAGYEGTNFARLVSTGQTLTSAMARIRQKIEDVRTFAGQTVTVSFWAKASTGTPNVAINFAQGFGSGGSSNVLVNGQKFAVTSSWVRYEKTFSVPSISGKTIGTGSSLTLAMWTSAGSDQNAQTDSLGIQSITVDFWGVQVEDGSVATAFNTATGTLQGELAACQRYYEKYSGTPVAIGTFYDATRFINVYAYKVTKRTTPTLGFGAGNTYTVTHGATARTGSSISAPDIGTDFSRIDVVTATSGTAAQSGYTTQTSYIEIIAEL